MERLRIRPIATEAWRHYQQLFLPLLGAVAVPAFAHAILLVAGQDMPPGPRWETYAFLLARMLVVTLAAISCHRIILLGTESVPRLGANGSSSRDWRFIGVSLTLTALSIVMTAVISVMTLQVGLVLDEGLFQKNEVARSPTYIGLLAATYVTSRLALRLPSIAIDGHLGWRAAWRTSRGNSLRLLLLVGGLPWLLHATQRTIADLFEAETDYVVVNSALFWLAFPLEIALLSVCYRRLVNASTTAP